MAAARQDAVQTARFGVPIETVLERRERLANRYDYTFGQERVFPALVDALLAEVPEGSTVLEVGAASGILTRPLLTRAAHLTALEPSAGLLRRLLESDVAESPFLSVRQGMVEDLGYETVYDVAVVTFTPRRGMGLLRLLLELATRVRDRVVVLLDDDGSLDWAYLARAAAAQGLTIQLRFVARTTDSDEDSAQAEAGRLAVILVAELAGWKPTLQGTSAWSFDAREIPVPYPSPRGAATRLVRFFLQSTDRAAVLTTDPEGIERLYGNLRTAVHRIARDEVTVRRHGDAIQLVRLPRDVEPKG